MRCLRLAAVFLLFYGSVYSQTCRPVYKNSYGGNGDDETRCIILTSDKGSIVAGRTSSGTAGDFDALLLKLTENGTIQWATRYGGSGEDVFTKVKQTADGG